MQNLLLGLGTALITAAAVVFMAVNWTQMGAVVQGLILLAITGLSGAATFAAARRQMPATAEAVGLATLVLALADCQALRVGLAPDVDATWFWASAIGGSALGAWVLGAATKVRSTRVAAAVLGQVPLLILLGGLHAEATVAGIAMLSQVGVVVVVANRSRRAPSEARIVGALCAVGTWLVVVGVATILAPFADGPDRTRCALVLVTGAAVAALVGWLRANDETVRTLALTAGTTSGLSAAAAVLTVLIPDGRSWAVLAILCAAVVAVGLRADHRWGRVPAGVAAAVGLLLAVPLAAAAATLLPAASGAWPHAWHLDASGSASAWAQIDRAPTAPAALALHLVAVIALLMAARPIIGLRWLMGSLTAAGLAAVALAPMILSVSIAETAILAIGAMVLCAVGALFAAPIGQHLGLGGSDVLRGSGLAAVVAWSTAAIWSPASAWLTLTVVGSGVAAASAFAMVGRKTGDSGVAVPAAIAFASVLAVEVGFAFAAAGRSIEVAVAAAGVAAVAFGVIAAMPLTGTRQHRDLDRRLSHWVEVTTWCIHGVVLAAITTAAHGGAGLRLTLGAGAIAAGLHGLRPRRRLLLGLAATEGLLLTWVQLAALSVRLPEAYSLPLALVLLGTGLIAEHRAEHHAESVDSWLTSGPGLVVAFVPTVLLSLNDPGLVRPLLGLAAGTVVLVAGALDRRKAPVDVGIAVVAVLGLRQLAPVAGELPNWATLGVAGTLLVAVGATFEQRRRDLRDVRLRYEQLR